MHRRLVNPALASLSGDRAQYFNTLVDRIERDPRTEGMANLVYLVLKESIPYLSTDLPESDLMEQLFVFVGTNRACFNKILFDPRYLENPGLFSKVTKEFVLQVLSSALEHHKIMEAETQKQRAANTYKFSWPNYDSENPFPYEEDGGEDAGDDET
ncbi:MAG: hypothetical protein ISR51_01915 [Rhodospirillales bacterium]|nr:hypothetical protein [Alphaproteobacteria bacterium]MBL6947408.1 hypothetical protein [Rhodospirillales bacterium]